MTQQGPIDLDGEGVEVAEVQDEAATKNLVFAAAERLFAVHGFQKVSVRDITAEAGVNLASVNYHFGAKDSLLLEIFRKRTAELNHPLEENPRVKQLATRSRSAFGTGGELLPKSKTRDTQMEPIISLLRRY